MICILLLAKSEVGCFIGNWFIGALAYADDIVLLAPSASAMCAMLHSCDTFAEQYNVIFNVSKSKCMFFPPKGVTHVAFTVNLLVTSMEALLSMLRNGCILDMLCQVI